MANEPNDPVRELFDAAADLPADRREQFLCAQSADDAVLQRVRKLLEHHEHVGEVFLGGAASADQSPAAPPHSAPQRIGPYTLGKVLGEGGMGTVYEAQQDHPRRRVALKLVRPVFLTPATLRRFEFEADMLGRLEHPGIARIYQSGVAETEFGRQPYFAMELVDGIRLDEWLRQRNPSQKERLELLIKICHAVHHAHTKGVIHRDLKPSNILITRDAQPKILDFGVAKTIDHDLKATTLQTQTGQVMGTLPYMAPEQAAGRTHDLDTSSDVYALGVIAYEMLGGRLPYALQGKPIYEAVQIICETEPSRLSSIDKSLRGDVETIVQKALEKDRTRRYRTAGELAADLKRYLDDEPISARPPSTWYQLRKFARRNKLLVSGVAALFLVMLLGIIGTSYGLLRADRQRRVAEQQREQAQAVMSFLTENVLAAATPEMIPDEKVRDTLMRVMLDPVAKSVEREFAHQPQLEAGVREALAMCYRSLGRVDLALPHAIRAVELCKGAPDTAPTDLAAALNVLATMRQDREQFDEANQEFRAALQIRRAELGDDHRDTLTSLSNLAALLRVQGQLQESERLGTQALAGMRRAFGETDRDTITAMSNVALVYEDEGEARYSEAEQLLRQALDAAPKVFGDNHPAILTLLNNLGTLLCAQQKYHEAEDVFSQLIEKSRAVLDHDHPITLRAEHNLVVVLLNAKEYERALPLAQDVLERRRKRLGTDDIETDSSENVLALVLQKLKRYDEAVPHFEQALERLKSKLPPGHPLILDMLNNIGMLYLDRNKGEIAEPLFGELYRLVPEAQLQPEVAAVYTSRWGVCLVGLGRMDHAREPLLAAHSRLAALRHRHDDVMTAVLNGLVKLEQHDHHPDAVAKWRTELAALAPTTAPVTEPATQPGVEN